MMMRLARITCIFIVLFSPGVLAAEGTGTVSGTVAYVENGKFVGEVKNGTVVVASNGHEVPLKANEQGDFTVELAVGKWLLVRVFDADGKKLVRDKTQARWFTISADRNSRFDVVVQAPKKEARPH
jgi:hypothetical protein